jgi:hypothetical protein
MIQPKRRNPLILHPMLKKGGAHGKTRKAERQACKQATRKLVAETRARD